jgi:hypothetical protein
VQLANVASLASRVSRLDADGEIPSNRWIAVQQGYAAYCRQEDGKAAGELPRVRLAMRFVLTEQVGVRIPGAVDQTRLKQLGETFGVFDAKPSIPERMTGGGRLIVLATAVTDDILAVPVDDDEPEQNTRSDAAESVTAVTEYDYEGEHDTGPAF